MALLASLTPGPVVLKVSEQMGFGLFAERDYGPREFITEYNGNIIKDRRLGGPYVVDVIWRGPSKRELWHIDGAYGFALSAKGRWVNEGKPLNATMKWGNTQQQAYLQTLGIDRIPKGSQFYWDYGPEYDRSHYH